MGIEGLKTAHHDLDGDTGRGPLHYGTQDISALSFLVMSLQPLLSRDRQVQAVTN